MKRTYNQSTNSDREATFHLYGTIGTEFDGNQFARELTERDRVHDLIKIRINSPGGDVFQGMSIVSAILSMKTPVHVYIDGVAASMAAVIAVCGERVYMQDYAKLMIHDPSFRENSATNEKETKMLHRVREMLQKVLSRRGKDETEVGRLMAEETWFSAEEAQTNRLCDEIISSTMPELKDLHPAQIIAKINAQHLYPLTVFDKPVEVENAVKRGFIDASQAELFRDLYRTNPVRFQAFINEKKTQDADKIESMLVKACRLGKFIYQERGVFEMVGKELGSKVLGALLNSIPEHAPIAPFITGEKSDRTTWGLNEYRKFAPHELRDNPQLYDRLVEKERTESGEVTASLEYYRKYAPDYLQRHPEVYEKLVNKNKSKR